MGLNEAATRLVLLVAWIVALSTRRQVLRFHNLLSTPTWRRIWRRPFKIWPLASLSGRLGTPISPRPLATCVSGSPRPTALSHLRRRKPGHNFSQDVHAALQDELQTTPGDRCFRHGLSFPSGARANPSTQDFESLLCFGRCPAKPRRPSDTKCPPLTLPIPSQEHCRDQTVPPPHVTGGTAPLFLSGGKETVSL